MVFHVRRRSGEGGRDAAARAGSAVTRAPTMWSLGDPFARPRERGRNRTKSRGGTGGLHALAGHCHVGGPGHRPGRLCRRTFDTKGRELTFIKNCLSGWVCAPSPLTSAPASARRPPMWGPARWARFHPKGVLPSHRRPRRSVAAMAEAFQRFVSTAARSGRLISAGGSGGHGTATPAMRRCRSVLPRSWCHRGLGQRQGLRRAVDICMMYSSPSLRINRISEQVLSNAAMRWPA